MELLDLAFYGNTLKAWIFSILLVLLLTVLSYGFKRMLYRRLRSFAERTETDIDNLLAELIGGTRAFFLFLLSLYIGSLFLNLPGRVSTLLRVVVILAFLFQAAMWGNSFLTFWIGRYKERYLKEDPSKATTIAALGFIGRLTLYSLILLLALDNMGIDITTLVAGLGIGGIAVALAVQNILGDLFASLSIVLDKPFMIGDFIIVDDFLGTVEHIGLKTTRIRSLSGEQIVFSNADLLKGRIRNYKRMFERRIVFTIGVTYQTPYEKLASIPRIIQEIVEDKALARFDRAHFKAYGPYSLDFEVVYYVKSPDYKTYMDIQQAINLAIFKRFEEEGIEFAYPTQTLYVARVDQ